MSCQAGLSNHNRSGRSYYNWGTRGNLMIRINFYDRQLGLSYPLVVPSMCNYGVN